MRDPIENISQLQKQLNDLQLENQILKNILDQAGLSYLRNYQHLNKMRIKKHMIRSREKELFTHP